MAKNYEEFRTHGKVLIDYICNYVKTIEKRPAFYENLKPGFLAPQLPSDMPENPESFTNVLLDFDQKILPGMVHGIHPDFFTFFGTGNAYPSVIGDMLSGAIATVGFSWASSPSVTELEYIMLDWYAKALNLPDFFLSINSNKNSKGGGALQASATDAMMSFMIAARDRAIKQQKNGRRDSHQPGLGGNEDAAYLPKLVCYASVNAHGCVEKVANLCMVKYRSVKVDADDKMKASALENAIREDLENGFIPFFVVGTSGTTEQGAFDELDKIGEVCSKFQGIWFHVDASYGGNFFMLPSKRYLSVGLNYADSINVNPNKLLLTAADCTCAWVKDVQGFVEAFDVEALYLKHQYEESIVDLRHWGTPLSRRFRSLKLFFMFRMYGLEGFQAFLNKVIDVGEHFATLVTSDSRFRVKNDAKNGIVCFRLNRNDHVNESLLKMINDTKKIHLLPTICKKKMCLRFVVNREYCSEAQVKRAWLLISHYATNLRDEIKRRRALSIEGQAEENDELNQENSLNFKDRMTIETNESAVKKSIQDDETPTVAPKDESAV
ncbi:CLUMA_CG002496, isoform A [Clunio marinus]|uniref:CLUMA_CG002496, isoform A n=1 Tax=Clunio marinus TaxID=568069 RepID=A0A1J1HLW8_9DIPT|nr:CLUMA_CG002496, isoform A [Clunio marinus]